MNSGDHGTTVPTPSTQHPGDPDGRPGRKPLLGRRYELVERVGVGGACSVYRARDTVFDVDGRPDKGRFVALKALHTELVEDEQQLLRFDTELEILSGLSNRHLPSFLGSYSPDDPVPWYAMELIDGRALSHPDLRDLPASELVGAGEQVCVALGFLHARGIVHRDVKPQNILLDGQGHATLIDLGIAQQFDVRFTVQGSILGTPLFMAPEQAIDPADADRRSDLYSLGVTLFSLLTRRSSMELSYEKTRSSALDRLPVQVRGAIDRATRPDPNSRFESADSMRSALAEATRDL